MLSHETHYVESTVADTWPASYTRHWFRAERQEANVIKLDQLAGLINLGRALASMESAMNQRLRARWFASVS
jgi:hypothetical protein